MKKLLSIFIVTLVCFSVSLLNSRIVHAATITISPPVVEVLIAPNKKLVQTFNVQYDGEISTLVLELHLAKPEDDQGHVTLDPAPLNPASIPLILTANPPLNQPLALEQGSVTISLTIEAASLEIPQDVYLALVMRTDSSLDPRQSTLTSAGISALILVTINPSGITPINLEIQNFSPPLFHDSWTPISFSPSLQNSVPILIRPTGTFEIIAPSGKILHTTELYPNLILGNSSRSIVDIHSTPLTWQPSWHDFGPHRARLTISTQGGSKLTEIEKVIWIIPIRILLTTTIVALVILTLLLLMKKSRKTAKLS